MKKRHSVVIVIYVVLTSVAIVIIALVSWVYNLFVGKMQYGNVRQIVVNACLVGLVLMRVLSQGNSIVRSTIWGH